MARSPSRIRRILSATAHLVLWPLIVVLILSYISPYVHPEKAWWLAFFGLGYPIIVSIALLVLIVFGVMRSKRFFILLFVLVGGLWIHVRYFSFYGTNFENAQGVHLMSYNVRLFNYYNWITSTDGQIPAHITDYIEQRQPDILCLQEYLIDIKNPDFMDPQRILKAGGFTDYRESFLISRKNRNIGVATFSKYPIIASGSVSAEDASRQFAFYTDLVIDSDTLRVYNIHLQSIKISSDDYELFNNNEGGYDENTNRLKRVIRQLKRAYPARVMQAEAIIEHAALSPHPVLICGDFNDPPVSFVYHLFQQDFTDAFRGNQFGVGSTYAGKLPAGRIDYIFHSPELQSQSFRIQREVFSDHYAIETKLQLHSED